MKMTISAPKPQSRIMLLKDIPIGTIFQATIRGWDEPFLFFRCTTISFNHSGPKHQHLAIILNEHKHAGNSVYDSPTQEFQDYVAMDMVITQ